MARFSRNRPGVVTALVALAEPALGDVEHGVVARGLFEAQQLGLPVVPTWILSGAAFQRAARTQLPPGHEPSTLIRVIHRPRGLEQASRARARLLSLPLDGLSEDLADLWRTLRASRARVVRASSSPSLSDQELAFSIGLVRTITGVATPEQLASAVRILWSTGVHEGALKALRARKVKDVAIAIVVQPLVDAQASGLLVTRLHAAALDAAQAPPGHPARLVLARRGVAGDGSEAPFSEVVSLDARGALLDTVRGVQRTQHVVDEAGLREIPIETGGPVLSEGVLARIDEIARRADLAGARRIEFVVDREGAVFVESFAPATGIGFPNGGEGATRWSRAQAADPGPGRLSPLSQRLAFEWTRESFRRAAAVRRAGVRPGHAVSPVRGRCYVNLSLLLEEGGGGAEYDDASVLELAGAQADEFAVRAAPARVSLPRIGFALPRLSSELRRIADLVGRFEPEAEHQRRWLGELDLAILPDDALKTTLREGREFFAQAARLSIDAMSALGEAQSLLRSLLSRAGHPASLGYAICAGVGDLETAEPAIAFGHVLAIAHRDRPACAWFAEAPRSSAADIPEGPTRRALRQFLDVYGNRAAVDVELDRPRWAEDPEHLLALLRRGLLSDPPDPDVVLSRARATADRELALLEARLSFVDARLMRELVARSRDLLRLSARLRVRIAHAFAMLRTIALEVDHRLRRLDPTLQEGSAFFCTFDELASAVGSYRADLEPLVALRRAEWAFDLELSDPLPAFCGRPQPWASFSGDLRVLRGVAAGPGTAMATARYIGRRFRGLEWFQPGDVAIVPAADAGLGPLYLLASAVIAEVGSPLSAGAVLARELGVPIVTGVPRVASRLLDGVRVRVDGGLGVIERAVP